MRESLSIKEALHLVMAIFHSPRTTLGEKKLKRALFTNLGIVLLLSLTLFLCFFLFYTHHLVNSNSKARLDIMETYTQSVVSNSDYLINSSIFQPFDQLYNSNSILALSYTSDKHAINGSAVARAKSDLRTMVSNSVLIETACLYVVNSQVTLTSSYHVSGAEYSDMIANYEHGLLESFVISHNNAPISLFSYGGKYVFAKDFYVLSDQKQSTLFLFLDMDEFYGRILDSMGDSRTNMNIYIFDSFGVPVWPSGISYPDTLPNTDYLNIEFSSNLAGNSYVFGLESPLLDWQYYLTADASLIHTNPFSLIITIAPFTLVMVLLICFMSLLASVYLYRPFYVLLNQLSDSTITLSPDAIINNEFDYLNTAVSSIIVRHEQLNNMLQAVSDDVTTRLFSNLMSGISIGYEEVSETLESIHSPFRLNALYTVVALRCYGSESNTRETNTIFTVVSQCMKNFNQKHDTSSKVIEMNSETLAIVLQFNDTSTTIVTGRAVLVELKAALKNVLTQSPNTYFFESGHLYHSILDVGFSYSEAIKAHNVTRCSPTTEESSQENSTHVTFLQHRIEQLVSSAATGNTSTLGHLIDSIATELASEVPDFSQYTSVAKELLNSCISLMLTYKYINANAFPDVFTSFSQSAITCKTFPELVSAMHEVLTDLINVFAQQIQRQQNPHVVATQQYIASHFTESELSLESIASSTGISASYLSKLYSECLGVRLLDYLSQFRLEMSLNDLLNSSKTITDIAAENGFASARNYIRSFKKHYDTTPNEYRKKHAHSQGRMETQT